MSPLCANTARPLITKSGTVDAFVYRAVVDSTSGSVVVDVRCTDSYVSVVDPRSGVYGCGDSPVTAFQDFQEAVREHRDESAG